MLTSCDVQARLKEVPFQPFRVTLSSGPTRDVDHPDMVIVGRRFVAVGTPSSEDPSRAEQVTRLSVLHIAELADIPAVRA